MKTLIVLLLFISTICFGQINEKQLPVAYIAYQPFDYGIGLRGDYYFNNWIGTYGSATWGTLGLYKSAGLKNHIKMTLGILIPVESEKSSILNVSIGGNYHHIQKIDGFDPENYWASSAIYEPFSFEIGISAKFKKFVIAFRTDVLRWEPCVDIGIPFGNYNMKERVNKVCLIK